MNKVLYWLSARPLFALIGKGYGILRKALDNIPGFDVFSNLATQVTDVIFGVIKFPRAVEERFEPYVEFQRGRQMDRAIVFVVLIYMALLGAYPSNLGHLDTAPQIWMALPIVSGFNPYLGLVSGLVFSLADWIGKFLPFESVYGADFGGGMQNFWGARIGYLLAYTTLIINGLLPGILARVFRQFIRGIAHKILPRKATQAAMGILMLLAAGALLYQVGGPRAVYAMSALSLMGLAMAMGPPPGGQGSPCMQCGAMLPPGQYQCMACGGLSEEGQQYMDRKHQMEAEEEQQRAYQDRLAREQRQPQQAQAGQPPGGGHVPPSGGPIPPGAGAMPPGPGMPPTGAGPAGGQDYLYEALATVGSMLGATVGIVASYEWAQQVGNYGAFYALRADPDVSCRDLSAGNYGDLQAQSPIPGAAAGVMPPGAAGAVTPGGADPVAPGPDTETQVEPEIITDPNTGETHPVQPGESAVRLNDAGTGYIPIVWDPTSGWRDVAAGARDNIGQVWDPNQTGGGAWVSTGLVEARQQELRDTAAFQQRERERVEQHRRDVERQVRENTARRERIRESERQAREARRQFLQERQRRLERDMAEANRSLWWVETATTGMEALKWTIDTTANIVADAAPPPAGTAFGYIYGGLTGAAEGATGSYLSGGSMLRGGATGAGEGLTTAFIGHMTGRIIPGGGLPGGAYQRGVSRALQQGARRSQAILRGGRGLIRSIRQSGVRSSIRSITRTTLIGEGSAQSSSMMWGTSQGGGGYNGIENPRFQSQSEALRHLGNML